MEDRQFSRMNMPIPMNYRIHISETSEGLWIGQGVLKNLSKGGAFFTCEDPLALAMGNSGTFTISIISLSPDFPVRYHIVFKGLVKRIEPPTEAATGFGVAVQLLSPMALLPKDQVPSGAPANPKVSA
jgi:hypothetical protein